MSEEKGSDHGSCDGVGQDSQKELSLVEKLQAAKTKRWKAQLAVTLLIVVGAGLNGAYMLFGGIHFFNNRSQDVALEAAKYIAPVAKNHAPRVKRMVEKVVPRYVQEFRQLASTEIPELRNQLDREANQLDQYVQAHSGQIEEQLREIMQAQEQTFLRVLEQSLGRKLDPKEVKKLSGQYKKAFLRVSDRRFQKAYGEHAKLVSELESNLRSLARTEPDLNRIVSPQETLGIFLEFMGVELQLDEL